MLKMVFWVEYRHNGFVLDLFRTTKYFMLYLNYKLYKQLEI